MALRSKLLAIASRNRARRPYINDDEEPSWRLRARL